jgi:hypothetical protein
MKCGVAEQHIVQSIYGELPDDAAHSLQQHLATCEHCRTEMHIYETLKQAMAFAPAEEPSASFLASSRIRLENALDMLPPPSLWQRTQLGFYGFFAQLKAAPGMAASLAVLGVTIGAAGGHFWNSHRAAAEVTRAQMAAPFSSGTPAVMSVSGIVQHPNTKMVEVHFNQMVPATVEGSIDDPEVRKLLLMATGDAGEPATTARRNRCVRR